MSKLFSFIMIVNASFASAQQLPKKLDLFVNGFASLNCDGREIIEKRVLKISKERVDQYIYDYSYDVELELAGNELARLTVAAFDVSNPSTANVQISKIQLPTTCTPRPSYELQITCGDHWYSVNMTMNTRTNVASFYFDGDSNPKVTNVNARVAYTRTGELKAQLAVGEVTFRKVDSEWQAFLTAAKGHTHEIANCSEY